MARKRGTMKQKRKQQRKRQASPPRNDDATAHWLTPAVWNRRCALCEKTGSVAYRHSDQSSLCELCLERLGIEPRESRRWKRAK
jgi:hypothetical protein